MIAITNYKAFLEMLARSEGTVHPKQKTKHNGYDVLVGGGTFEDFSKHPNARIKVRINLVSTAAGRYQFLNRTWVVLAKRLNLPDFGPQSQDLACLELLRECGSLKALDKGDFRQAVQNARRIWASLPGAGYGQLEHSMAKLERIYREFGGRTA